MTTPEGRQRRSTGRRIAFASIISQQDSDDSLITDLRDGEEGKESRKPNPHGSSKGSRGKRKKKKKEKDEGEGTEGEEAPKPEESGTDADDERRERRGSMARRQSKIMVSKVEPEVLVAPAVVVNPSETDLLKPKRKTNAGGLTLLPSRAAFEGGLATVERPKKYAKPKNLYEVQMPKNKAKKGKEMGRKSIQGLQKAMGGLVKGHTYKGEKYPSHVDIGDTRTFGSLIDKLRAIYGGNFQGSTAGQKKRRKKKRDSDSDSEQDEENKAKKSTQLKEGTYEELTKRLYGSQSRVIDEFLEERRDCERELTFRQAKIPRWVRYFWKINLFYEFCTSCVLLFTVIYGTFAAIFGNHSSDLVLLGSIDYFIEADCIIRLLVELWRSFTKCQYEVFTVNYTFLLSLLDMIAIIPYTYLYLVFANIEDINHLECIPLFLIPKLFHMFRAVKIFEKLQDDMNIRGHVQFLLAMIRYVIRYFLIVHVLSCIMFYIGHRSFLDWVLNRTPESSSEKEYVNFLSIRKHLADPPKQFYRAYPDPLGLYCLSLYLVVATISTVGFGDFFPTNNSERILIIFMMMVGSIWISGELAYNLGTFFNDLDASRYMMFFRVNCIKIHLQNYQISNFISSRTEQYYWHLWRYRKGVHEIDLSYLPHCVQEELKFDICEEMFYKSPMFRGLDETFLMVLAKSAKVSLYSPRMILFERGSITKQMYFILQGEVAVAAGIDDDRISAIHRAGCLVGEINLFMSIPYEQTTYTRTVCTIMTITKKDLMLAMQDFPHIFAIMRDKVKKRRERFRNAFELVQVHPYVQWLYPKSLEDLKCDPDFPVKVNSMHGWNKAVTGFPIGNEDEQVIIEMTCDRSELTRIESHAYRLVSVPQIYYSPGFWASVLNWCLLSLWFYLLWVTPFCATMDDFPREETYFSACIMISNYWPVIIFVCLIDFVVELVTACPSTGLYYKMKDGIEVKKASFGFYCDLISMFPFEIVYPDWYASIFRLLLKMWKIGRVWDYLDERFALKLFYIRIAKMTFYLFYLTYMMSLMLLSLVCEPGRKGTKCNDVSFFNPQYPDTRFRLIKDRENPDQFLFMTPIVFAASALTSVGFGNIFPQTTKEIKWLIFFMILGHFFCSYILTQLTSALSARLTPKLIFHQKLLVVKTFVRHNGLSTKLLRKLIEYYDLQHQYMRGCALPESTHLMYDGHKVLLEDVFLVEGEIFFDGVPAFSKIPSQAIIDMSRLMQRFVVPPDLVFVQQGEVRRTLYIIVNGTVALYQHGEQAASAILTSTGHFGLRDLMFGEPYAYRVKTLSYVVLYAVDYKTFQEVLGDDEGLMEFIKDEMSRREDEIQSYFFQKIVDQDGPSQRAVVPPSWIRYADHPDKPLVGGDKTFDHFEKPFLYYHGSNFIRENTMPQVLHPAGTFGMMWQVMMGLAAIANTMFLIIETFMGYRAPGLRIAQLMLDLLFCADIYMKCHWAYYSAGAGEMRYHPLKTWIRYIFHGPYFIEIGMMIPLELILAFSGSTNLFGYGPGHSWFTKLRWIRFFRIFKFFELYTIVHRIFENRTYVMLMFYLSIALLMSVFLAALGFFFACPTTGYLWTEGDEYKLPVCLKGTWVNHKTEEKILLEERWIRGAALANKSYKVTMTKELFYARSLGERLVLGLYYVGQVLMVIGFGDLATFRNKIELHFLTIIALFGFIVCQAIISDITSAQIDTDEVRAINREKLERLGIALAREGASQSFKKYVRAAFRLSWSYAKGLQPNDLFSDLHPVLHRELLNEYIGDVLERVPVFIGFTDAFTNALKFKFRIEFYPRGSLITREGDLDYRMYVVVKGDVWVCDKDDKWVCTMSTGESFGEMGMLYDTRRRFSAYAATNLQILVLDALDFSKLLDNYPMQRKVILRNLLDFKRESYVIKAYKQKQKDLDGYLKEQKEKTELLSKYPFSRPSYIAVGGNVMLTEKEKARSVKKELKYFQRIVGYGSSDIVEHYIYFASEDGKFNFVLHPSCLFLRHFYILTQTVYFLDPIIVLFHVFFYYHGTEDWKVIYWTDSLSNFCDAVLWLSIIFKFFTAVEISERKTYCKDIKKIILDYLLQPSKFLLDVFIAFPYDWLEHNLGSPLMCFRCLLSFKFFTNMIRMKEDIEVSTLQVNLATSMSFLLYMAHLLACIFFYLSCPNISDGIDNCKTHGWIHKFRIDFGNTWGEVGNETFKVNATDIRALYDDPRPSHWYVISLYWVMAVLTTCGFGDITPTNFDEIALANVCIFGGSMFLSILLGNITTGLSSVHQAKHQFLGRVEKMLDYLEVIGLSSVGHQTLSAYCEMTWTNCRGVNYNDIADILPLYVQQDVYLALYQSCVTHCLFFGRGYELSFVRAICCRLRHYMFLPGMRIANELEPGTGIYIVMRGSVTSFQINPETGDREFIKRYEENQVFGRIPALFPGALYNKCYRAEDKSEVLLMYHADMRQLLTKYPKWRIFIKELIAQEYKYFAKQTDLKSIVTRKMEMDEKLTKNLTYEQFSEAANLFASKPPKRTGIVNREKIYKIEKEKVRLSMEHGHHHEHHEHHHHPSKESISSIQKKDTRTAKDLISSYSKTSVASSIAHQDIDDFIKSFAGKGAKLKK